MGTVAWIAAVVVAFLALVHLLQDRLLYFPMRATVEQMQGPGLRPWPSAPALRGLLAEPQAQARGTAIVFHGNAGHAGHRDFYAQALVTLGWRVILAEYPGYGPRNGKPAEATLVADASETVAMAHAQFGRPVLLLGESLGAAVAAAAAERQQAITARLVLITPWDRLEHVAGHHYPWLPVRWLLRDRYDSSERLTRFDRPVVVVIAEHDTVVPARFGRALHALPGGTQQLVVIGGAGHNDWPNRVDQRWWDEVTGGVSDVVRFGR